MSSSGGVGRVFSIENSKKSSPTLIAKIVSHATFSDFTKDGYDKYDFNFDYEVEIKFSRSTSSIYVSREILRLYKLCKNGDVRRAGSFVGAISFLRKNSPEDSKPKMSVGPRLLSTNPRNPLNIGTQVISAGKNQANNNLDRIDLELIDTDESFLNFRHRIPALDAVRTALTRGRSFNIDPNKAREPDDLIRPPGIGRDGSGLSSTLHAMQMSKKINAARDTREPGESIPKLLIW